MLVLFFMLSGASACSVAVVKSLNMGNRTDTHTHTFTDREASAGRLIFNIFRGMTFVWLPQGFVTARVQHYS